VRLRRAPCGRSCDFGVQRVGAGDRPARSHDLPSAPRRGRTSCRSAVGSAADRATSACSVWPVVRLRQASSRRGRPAGQVARRAVCAPPRSHVLPLGRRFGGRSCDFGVHHAAGRATSARDPRPATRDPRPATRDPRPATSDLGPTSPGPAAPAQAAATPAPRQRHASAARRQRRAAARRQAPSRSISSRYRAAVRSTTSSGSTGGVPVRSQFALSQSRTICLSNESVRLPDS
jgi:hypothetical protein